MIELVREVIYGYRPLVHAPEQDETWGFLVRPRHGSDAAPETVD